LIRVGYSVYGPEALAKGAKEILHKPLSNEELEKKIKEVLF